MASADITTHVLLIAGSYFLGSIPVGLWIVKATKGVDVRQHGSGNIGATNVFRVAGPVIGTISFLLDVVKGLVPPLVAASLGLNAWWQVGSGLASMVGHSASPFLRFKGGKGIATALGILFGLSWKVAVSAWALWAIAFFATGYVSIGSILAAISVAPFTVLFYPNDSARLSFGLVAGALALWKHRANMQRLRAGTESKMLYKKRPIAVEPAPTSEQSE
jgi:glycerol-3-phosphate acyltransferase PlsY